MAQPFNQTMGNLKMDDLATQFVSTINQTLSSKKSEAVKRAEMAGTAKAYAYLFGLALGMNQPAAEDDDDDNDDPALDPENDYCSCGRLTDNYPVICDHCRYMARIP